MVRRKTNRKSQQVGLPKFEVFQAAKHPNLNISDPPPEWSLKITHGITDNLRPNQEMFEQLKRKHWQLPITFFSKQTAADEPTQSTSQAEPEPIASSATRSPWPKPGL